MRVSKILKELLQQGCLIVMIVLLCGFVSLATEANSESTKDSYFDDETQTQVTPGTGDENSGDESGEAGEDANSKDNAATNDGAQEDTVKNGWSKNKNSYYVNNKKVTGVKKINGKLYYFKQNGNLYKKKGLCKINKQYYYISKDNSLKTGVVKVGKVYYYFQKKSGVRYQKSGICKVDGKYYYFGSDYSLKSGWKRDSNNKRYYFDTKKFAAKTGWSYVGKFKYYFKKNGQLLQDVRSKLTKTQKQDYYIKVNRAASCVTVYARDGKKGYTIPVVSFVCSGGNATPIGTFKIRDKLRWHELMGPCWGQWCMHLTDSILFHSVYYNRPYDNRSLDVGAYNRLGTIASHGCVRLRAGDSKWIYDNCKVGTKVTIYDNSKDPGPFDKPVAQKLRAGHTWDPTDPTIK